MTKRIEIVGILGAGKTTLLHNIDAKTKNTICVYEDLSLINEIWNFIETDKNRNHYFLLISAYYLEAACSISEGANKNGEILITDYSLSVHHHVYAYYSWKKGLINDIEWNTLSRAFTFYSNILPPIAAIVEIDITPLKAQDNLKIRNRVLDKNTPINYIEEIYEYLQVQRDTVINNLPSIKLTSEEIMLYSSDTQQKIKSLLPNTIT